MKANNNDIDIRTIELYVKGKLKPEDKQAIDLLRATDPFLDAAISGYEEVPDSLSGYKDLNKRFAPKGKWNWYIGFALLTFCVAFLYWVLSQESSPASIPLEKVKLADRSTVIKPHVALTLEQEKADTIQVSPVKRVNTTFFKPQPVHHTETVVEEMSADTIPEVTIDKPAREEAASNAIILPAKPATTLDVTVYYVYTREYILNTYLAITGGTKKSYTEKGRDELVRLKLYLQDGQLKKALAMVTSYNIYSKENAKAMNEWIDILGLVEKKDYEEARVRMKALNMEFPLRMQNTYNQLMSELH